MKVNDAIRTIVRESGKSQRQISEELDRVPTFLSAMLTKSKSPSVPTLQAVAQACGYRLMLVPNDASKIAIEIDVESNSKK